ncbi:hypothetical protein DRF65_24440 [Chryseobacterium pennae]|uniref:Uncharacterized protein n=1 Tax=Chryseobacterium pennae TaxID=2258962 RepID=A0A3D9C1T0_9FLAO|nr:hypothetical protein DRF65_24440 [Chryseobacterium pennae]
MLYKTDCKNNLNLNKITTYNNHLYSKIDFDTEFQPILVKVLNLDKDNQPNLFPNLKALLFKKEKSK